MKYKIYYTAHMCDHVYVEAESRDDARDLGHDMANSEHPESAHIDIDDVISEDDEATNSTHNYHDSATVDYDGDVLDEDLDADDVFEAQHSKSPTIEYEKI